MEPTESRRKVVRDGKTSAFLFERFSRGKQAQGEGSVLAAGVGEVAEVTDVTFVDIVRWGLVHRAEAMVSVSVRTV